MKRRNFMKNSMMTGGVILNGIHGMNSPKSAFAQERKQYDLILKGGHVIDPANNINKIMDVAVSGGEIARVDRDIPAGDARRTADVSGYYVTPGLIDIHTHIFKGFKSWVVSVDPEYSAFSSGVTTIVDAGTVGANYIMDFKRNVDSYTKTRVLAFLNICADGMTKNDQDNPAMLNVDTAVRTANNHTDIIVGYKSAHYWQND
ncbi:MAG: amidohydrolase family protein, partial [Candidatus Latescibacteria bacterium]|nr:amidohydrolase family protein [Candidatus Latescibacterota bacterium]